MEFDRKETVAATVHMSSRKELLSAAMKRTCEWIFSQEIPSDVTIHVGGTSFSLHKFPLISKCGYIRKMVLESSDAKPSSLEIPEIPGGAEAFELAAKFCYGSIFEISSENIAMLRCVAEYLQMNEDYATGNLVEITEAYLNEVVLRSLAGAVSVLHKSENLLPIAEKVKVVSRCIDAIAYIACKESQFYTSGSVESGIDGVISSAFHPKPTVDWGAEELTVLRIDMFQRVLLAMMSRGIKQNALGLVLMLYAQKSLSSLEAFGKGRNKIEPSEELEKRVIVETIVSLLPRERNEMSVSILSMLLRAAIYLETTVACRFGLEKRIALQLEHAVVDDLLVPSYSFTGNTLFDVDTVQRIMINYLEYHAEGNTLVLNMERVGKLMENYLAEIASDRNLSVSKFIGLAELVPEQSRVTEDGMYRAIDIYFEAHPTLSDIERKRVCSLMNCEKLSNEACAHASQNDRLPVQTVVQVLYYEQQRLRDVMNESKVNGYPTDIHPVSDELSGLIRENEDLKLELMKMKTKMTTDVTSAIGNRQPLSGKPPPHRKSIMNSVSKRLGWLYPFVRIDGVSPSNTRGRTRLIRDRRHSIS